MCGTGTGCAGNTKAPTCTDGNCKCGANAACATDAAPTCVASTGMCQCGTMDGLDCNAADTMDTAPVCDENDSLCVCKVDPRVTQCTGEEKCIAEECKCNELSSCVGSANPMCDYDGNTNMGLCTCDGMDACENGEGCVGGACKCGAAGDSCAMEAGGNITCDPGTESCTCGELAKCTGLQTCAVDPGTGAGTCS